MNWKDLLAQAELLAKRSPKKPKQADLKRAVSAAYYAVFHALCRSCADTMIGTGPNRPEKAWLQAYRAVEHGIAKKRCVTAATMSFPSDIKTYATAFVTLQTLRHSADYDPSAIYKRSEVMSLIGLSGNAISALKAAPLRDRKAFAAYILLVNRP